MQIELTDQEAEEFAAWLREKGNNYIQRAEMLSGKGKRLQNGDRSTHTPIAPNRTDVTQEQFEASIIERSGRVYDIAKRLNVSEEVVRGFLRHPNSRVSVQARGWIKPNPQ